MSAHEDMAGRHSRMLAEAAEVMLSAMHRLHARLESAETDEAARDAALALQRVNRGLRQTILLEAKLAKDEVETHRRRADQAQAAKKAEVADTAARLKVRARGVILEACDSHEDAEGFLDDLDLWAADYAAGADDLPLDELVVRICRDLGLTFDPAELACALRPLTPASSPGELAANSS